MTHGHLLTNRNYPSSFVCKLRRCSQPRTRYRKVSRTQEAPELTKLRLASSTVSSWFPCKGNLHNLMTETLHPIALALKDMIYSDTNASSYQHRCIKRASVSSTTFYLTPGPGARTSAERVCGCRLGSTYFAWIRVSLNTWKTRDVRPRQSLAVHRAINLM
jgi:hypothetical protein